MKNRIICMLLALILTASLFAGCSAKEAAPAPEAPAATEAAAVEEAAAPEEAPAPEEEPEEEPEVSAAEEAPEAEEEAVVFAIPTYELALSYIDRPVEELIADIGEPESSSYASSCAGPGEDGELYYEGVTVYTYREGDAETVVDVYEE